MTVAPLAAIISTYSFLAIPATILVQRPARMEFPVKLLFSYSLIAFASELLPGVFHTSPTCTRILSFAFTIFEYTVFTLFYWHFLRRKTHRWCVLGGSLIFVSIAIIELQKFGVVYYSRFNAATAVILIISYSLLLFHEWLTDDPMELIYKKPAFWITLGCLVYLSGHFFFFIAVGKQWEQNWVLHAVCNLVKNLLFVMAIWQTYPATRPRKTA